MEGKGKVKRSSVFEEVERDRVFEFGRKIASQRNPEEEKGFWIFHPDGTQDAINRFRDALGTIKLYYAVKCNPHPYIVKYMVENGDGFDCASINEIKEVIKLGCDPKNITFSQVAKLPKEIREAYKLGVRLTIVDSIEEVEKISKMKDEVKDLRIMIRFQSNDPTAVYSLAGRFGLEEDEIDPVLEAMHKNGLTFCGVHFHIGVGAHNPDAFTNGIRIAKETFDKAKKMGYNPDTIDIGGGFSHQEPIKKFGKVIHDALVKYGLDKMFILAEPGQFIARNSFSYVSNIILKHKKTNNPNLIYYFICEGKRGALGFFNVFECKGECFPLNPKGRPKVFSLVGSQTCDSHDIICEMELEEMETGDWVVFYCLGAYSLAVSSNFNGFESRDRPVFQMPMKNTNYVVKIPEDVEKNGIPALWGLPNGWSL